MSNYETKPGEGSLFPGKPDRPEVLSGSVKLLDGSEAWLNVYKATKKDGTPVKTKDGEQIYNVRLKPKAAQSDYQPDPFGNAAKAMPSHPSDLDDSIPF